MSRVYRTSIEATNHKAPQESPAVRPQTPSSAPPENTERDLTHARTFLSFQLGGSVF